jgi:hypothetical protein
MSDVDAQITLRDTIEQAIETHEPTPVENNEPVLVDKPRDEVGRFAPKVEAKEPAPVDLPPVKPRPSSWKKDYEEHWTKLDPTLQDYINQRESDYAKGVSTYKQNWDNAAPIYEAMQPFIPLLQEHNIQPQQWISNLGNAHKMLATGSQQEKLQMFAKLANDYGVSLQGLQGQQHDPQFSQIAQELSQIKNEWSSFKTERERNEQTKLQDEITSFAQNAPHFDQVRDTMAGLLQSGVAQDLKSAYEKAIRLNDDIWQQNQAEAQQAKAREAAEQNQQRVAQAKAKAVSPRSTSPTGTMGTGTGKKGLRETLSEQLEQAMGGRV